MSTTTQHELLTPAEVIDLLRLADDLPHANEAERERSARERLRNLIRRHGLPVHGPGGLQRFWRDEVLAWMTDPQKQKARRPLRKKRSKDAESSASAKNAGR